MGIGVTSGVSPAELETIVGETGENIANGRYDYGWQQLHDFMRLQGRGFDRLIDAVVGLHRGDEAKGRFTDMWAIAYDIIARYSGGPNAGHTVISPEGIEYKLQTIPSGIIHPDKKCVIGDGVFVDPVKVVAEIEYLRSKGVAVSPDNLLISSSAHLILPHHIVLDELSDATQDSQGTTKSGIRYVDADFGGRKGVRAEIINQDIDELADIVYGGLLSVRPMFNVANLKETRAIEQYKKCAAALGEYVTDTMLFINAALINGKKVLGEGAQAFLLDKYRGMWPYTTSTITTSGGIHPGLGVAPQRIGRVLGVAKPIPSHVGGGCFVTEAPPHVQEQLHGDPNAPDGEKGTNTGRLRRLGHLDLPIIRRANLVNGTTEMALAKFDWLNRYRLDRYGHPVDLYEGGRIPVCVAHERNGKTRYVASNAAYKLEESEGVYEHLPGWTEDVSEVRRFKDLPANARAYVKFVEEETGVPISLIGVGQRRDQVIER